jgi:hypothetical protein
LTIRLIRRSGFFRFANRAWTPRPGQVINARFVATDDDLKAFRDFLEAEEVEIDDDDWAATEADLRQQLTYEIVSAHGDMKEAFKAQCETDAQVRAALDLWSHASRHAILADASAGTTPVIDGPVEREPAPRPILADRGEMQPPPGGAPEPLPTDPADR